MVYGSNRKSSNDRSKLHAVRQRRRSSKNHAGLSSCVHGCVGSEGLQKIRDHIMKALDFGIESGYLVPTDATCKMLRVSSDLLEKRQRRRIEKTNETTTMKYRRKGSEDSWNLREKENKEIEPVDSSTKKFEECSVQEARRKRKNCRRNCRSRSRSEGNRCRSRRRSRRRGSSENPEKLGEDEDDYEPDKNSGKKNARNERANSGSRSSRSKTQEIDRTDAERSDDISDISLDEYETDEEGDKKKSNTTKS
ncbi:serine/arginine-rich splicing factor 4-like [Vespa velutina]|uniref:serine/arginine-rich splicing factor 4-like n=1 Tax=Vespa velutina TaxID=202808 RepID=UPI001FB1AD8E|nr:serine/arginine-rich splicing factor 4-like [Vespa velutina]